MMRDKYGVAGDPDCYPGTDVLINHLGLRDADLLAEAEAEFAATAAAGLDISGPPFDFPYLCRLHRELFEELYEWAGEVRTADVSKGQTRFCSATRIIPEADRIFSRLASDAYYLQMERAALVHRSAELYDELNVLHPFRDGNGRTLRLFFEHLILSAGFSVSWVEIRADEWIEACIDGYAGNIGPLEALFDRCIGLQLG